MCRASGVSCVGGLERLRVRDLGCNVHRLENSGVWSLECLGIRVLTVSLLVAVVDCTAPAGLMAACPGRAGTAR